MGEYEEEEGGGGGGEEGEGQLGPGEGQGCHYGGVHHWATHVLVSWLQFVATRFSTLELWLTVPGPGPWSTSPPSSFLFSTQFSSLL